MQSLMDSGVGLVEVQFNSGCIGKEQHEDLKKILPVLETLRGGKIDRVRVTTVDGGTNNRNYRVGVGDADYFARVASDSSRIFGVDLDRESICTRIMGERGFGAKVCYSNPEAGILITEYLDGTPGSIRQEPDWEATKRIINTMQEFHASGDLPEYNPFDTIRSIYICARRHRLGLPEAVSVGMVEIENLEQLLLTTPYEKSACNNDFHPGQTICCEGRLRVIDWEYGGKNDGLFDLAHCFNRFHPSEDKSRSLIEQYRNGYDDYTRARYELWRVVSAFWCAIYYYAQDVVSEIDYNYASEGERFLSDFAELIRSEKLQHWKDKINL